MGTEVSNINKHQLFFLLLNQCCKISPYKIEANGEIKTSCLRNSKNKQLETEACVNDYSSQMMLKKEIIKIYNDNNNEPNNTFLVDNNDQAPVDIAKLKKVYSISKKIMLEVMPCDNPENFVTIEIDPFGYVNSKRQKKDGITYFGYEVGQERGDLCVDFVMKNSDNYFYDDAFNGRHFMIKYNPDELIYYIKDLGRGFGTFIKIQEWTELRNNLLLNIGENYIVFSLGEDDDEEEEKEINDININKESNSLNIKIFSINTQQKVYKLLPSQCPITIGRSSDNTIFIDDDMLSRIHCTIDYSNEKWYIQDGYAKNGLQEEEIKKSTNGSWIYAYDEIPIVDKMIFKANHNLFICNLI